MKANLIIEQGADWQPVFQYLDEDGMTPIDLTGYSARMQIRQTAWDPTVLADMTTGNGKITISAPTGEVAIHLTAAETSALSFATAVYDLEIVAPNGLVTRLAAGALALSLEVTR